MLRQELIEDIRSKADIVQVISSYGIDVVKKGKDYVAICPFHQMVTPRAIREWNTTNGKA